MDAILVLCFFGAIFGVWRFASGAFQKRHFIVRHLIGSAFGLLFALIPFVIAVSSGQIAKALMAFVLLAGFSLGFDATIRKIAKILDIKEVEDGSLSEEVAKLRKIGAKGKSSLSADVASSMMPNRQKGDYYIQYTDASGNRSAREISEVKKRGSNISCHCHYRNETRAFKLSRVDNGIVCNKSGEIMSRKNWAKTL